MEEEEAGSRISSPEDVTSFLYEIQMRPDIWDCSLADYPNKRKKAAAWDEIFRIFCLQDFDTLTRQQKKIFTNDLQNRWKQLRLSFVREYNKYYNKEGHFNYGGRKPRYSDNLTFLVPAFHSKQWSSKHGIVPVKEEEKKQHRATISVTNDDNQQFEVVQHYDVVMDEENNHEEIVSTEEQRPFSVLRRDAGLKPQIRKSELSLEESFSLNREARDDARDEDELFLMSLLSHLKEIPKEKKLLARCEIMHVLVKYAKPKS